MITYRVRKTRSFVFLEERSWFFFFPYWERIECTAFENVAGALNFILKLHKTLENLRIIIIENSQYE